MIWAQPGRREVDHIPARKGVMPVKKMKRRLWGRWVVGLGSQRGITQGDSERILWVKAVSAGGVRERAVSEGKKIGRAGRRKVGCIWEGEKTYLLRKDRRIAQL